jgi:hypothetical protein
MNTNPTRGMNRGDQRPGGRTDDAPIEPPGYAPTSSMHGRSSEPSAMYDTRLMNVEIQRRRAHKNCMM